MINCPAKYTPIKPHYNLVLLQLSDPLESNLMVLDTNALISVGKETVIKLVDFYKICTRLRYNFL